MEQFEHTIIFSDRIETDTVQDLIDEMHGYSFVNLYFSTPGGHVFDMDVLVDYLNYRYKVNSLKLIIGTELISAGTLLLTDYVGPIFLHRDFYLFMFHSPDMEFSRYRPKEGDDGIKRLLDKENEKYYAKLEKLGITKPQMAKIRKGENVFWYADQVHKLNRKFFSSVEEEVTQHYTIYKNEK